MDTMDTPAYERPVLRVEGSVEDLTHGRFDGDFLDRTFPTNTPRGKLTFS